MAKKDPFQQIMANVDWTRLVPILQPLIVFGAWLAFSKIDKRADAVSKLIAVCEPIPAIDLNVPKPVVLASLYHALDEAMEILDDVVKFLKDVEIPSWENIKEDIVEDIDPIIPGIEDEAKFLSDFAACKKNAKDTLGFLYNKFTAWPWITSCMVQKGYTRSIIEERVRQALGI